MHIIDMNMNNREIQSCTNKTNGRIVLHITYSFSTIW